MTHTPRHARSERGFSMFLVIMAMFITTMFVAAGFAAANGDFRLSGDNKDRKVAYAAAEAGLNFYEAHLNAGLRLLDALLEPARDQRRSEPGQPGVGPHKTATDPRNWRNVPKSQGQYTIEVLPSVGNGNNPKTGKAYSDCVEGDQNSVLEQKTGTFRIRITGRPTAASKLRRSIIATFKRKGFLDYLWFTYYRGYRPSGDEHAVRPRRLQQVLPGQVPLAAPVRAGARAVRRLPGDPVDHRRRRGRPACTATTACSSATSRRSAARITLRTRSRSRRPANGLVAASGCTQSAKVEGIWTPGADKIEPPTDDQDARGDRQDRRQPLRGPRRSSTSTATR